MQKCLVLGGAGFIGSRLSQLLLENNDQVVCVDDLSLGKQEYVDQLSQYPHFMFYKINIAEQVDELRKVFQEHHFDKVYQFAANSLILESFKNPDLDLQKTFMTTYNTLKVMREFETKKIIFSSSSTIYGEKPGKMKESDGPYKPESHYGAMKLASEAMISSYCYNYGMQAFILRFPNIIGPQTTHGVVFDFVKKLHQNPHRLEVLGNGLQERPFLHVDDLLEGIFFVEKHAQEKVNIFNIAPQTHTTVKQVAHMVCEKMGLSPEIIFETHKRAGWIGDIPCFEYDVSKLNELGYQVKYTSDEAILKTLDVMLKKDK